VAYANKNGLLGVFIWALDLDDKNHDALNAVLSSKGGLGAFKEQNGVGLNSFTNYTQGHGACFLGTCSPTPGCSGPYQAVGHQIRCDQQGTYRQVCCPLTNTPDPETCVWRGGMYTTTIPKMSFN
jgi:chitinase